MDFSLLGGAVTARAEPGATRVRMIESGAAGDVTNGQFDQLENIFQFEGEIFLSTEEGPYDLSSVAPLQADLLGIRLENRGNQLVATLSVDLQFTAAIAVPVLGQIPLTIQIQGNLEAIAALMPSGDFDGNGVLDASDIDALHAAIRQQDMDPRFDLNGDGQLNSDDSCRHDSRLDERLRRRRQSGRQLRLIGPGRGPQYRRVRRRYPREFGLGRRRLVGRRRFHERRSGVCPERWLF